MPIRARSFDRLVFLSFTDTPETVIRPSWNGSSPFTVLISVDLPEPEGPHTTTTSPLLMATEQSVSTCTGPYHLETFLMSIIAAMGLAPALNQLACLRAGDRGS